MTPRFMNQILKALVVMVVLILVGVLYLGDKKIVTVANETSRLKAVVEVNQQQIKVYEKTKDKVATLGYVNELANKVLPADKEQSVIVAEVSEFAKRSNLSISQITFSDVAKDSGSKTKTKTSLVIPKGVQVIPVTIQMQSGASYNDVLDFLRTAETNQRKMQLTSINLKPNVEDRQILEQVNISMNLYAKQLTSNKAVK
jgi:Tfp pilus assembly protein PilO